MDEWILLAMLAFAIAIVLPIGLFFAYLGLSSKVKDLQRQISALRSAASLAQAKPSQPAAVAPTPVVQETPEPEPESDVEEDIVIPAPEPADIPIWQTKSAETPPEPVQYDTPKAYVFKAGFGDKIKDWMQKNWFFAVAGVALALAGVFLVQYGVDQGLLTPRLRVLGAIALGGILMGAGEYVRRKIGSDEEGEFEFLPSIFAGAGLVSIFAGILAGRLMYDIIAPTPALISLTIVGMCAVVFGWYYGPFMAILGVFGALLAPFIVGGSGESAEFLYFFFAGIAGVALAIDSFKRWAWLSVLGLIGAYVAAWVLYGGIGAPIYMIGFALLVATLALIVPERRLIPTIDGAMLSEFLHSAGNNRWAEFPTRVAGISFLASAAIVGVVFLDSGVMFWPVLGALVLMLLATIFWMRGAASLSDLAYIPALGALAAVYFEGLWARDVWRQWYQSVNREVIDSPPATLALFLVGAIAVTLMFAWRSWKSPQLRKFDAGFAAAFAVVAAIALELEWSPRIVLGESVWALYLGVIAVVMTLLSERFARTDIEDRTRPALFALSAITMISFMCFVLFGSVGLTIAIAVLAFAAAFLGQRFNLPLLDYYVQAAAIAVSWRLVLIPGVVWAFDAEILMVLFVYVVSIGLLIAAYWLRRKDAPISLQVVLESASWSLSGVFVSVLLVRWFDYIDADSGFMYISMLGLVWLIMAFNQIWRIRDGAGMRTLRQVLAGGYLLLGFGALALSVTVFNPRFSFISDPVRGPYIFDNLFMAYAIPAMLFTFVALKFTHIRRSFRQFYGSVAAFFAALYIGLEIRRWWQGDYLYSGVSSDGEIYSYTVAMLLTSAILLGFAYVRKSKTLRRFALIAVGLTVAKMLLIDIAGLSGLIRSVAFLVLALTLIPMALVNRILQKNEAAD